MEWLDSVVLVLRWLLAAFLVYGGYLCLFRASDIEFRARNAPRRTPTRLIGASACLLLIAGLLTWRPEITHAEVSAPPAQPSDPAWPPPNPVAGGDGHFLAYEYH